MAKTEYLPHPDLEEPSYGELQLRIFNQFWVDHNLPKYAVTESDKDSASSLDLKAVSNAVGNTYTGISGLLRNGEMSYARHVDNRGRLQQIRSSLWQRCKTLLSRRKKLPVQVFFDGIKNLQHRLPEKVTDILQALDSAKQRYDAMGQANLIEKLEQYREILVLEHVLATSGFPVYVPEADIVEFMKRADRGVCVDYIKYYMLPIPEDVAQLKMAADKLLVFDNYCIIHYDPHLSAVQLTSVQLEKARDPILFGMIRGSRKLYYIADWVTSKDDLTLDKLIHTIGKQTTGQLTSVQPTTSDIMNYVATLR